MIKRNEVARYVRVKLNSNFIINSLSQKYLACEPVVYISDSLVYNDQFGEYVLIRGGSNTISGIAYLNQLDLEFPIIPYDFRTVDYNKDLSMFKSNLEKD